MQSEAEPRRLADSSFGLLDRVAERIRPSDPDLEAWTASYLRQHRRRFAVDLALI